MSFSTRAYIHAFCLLCIAVTLAGCAGQLPQAQPSADLPPADQARQAAAEGDYARAAELYMQAASQTQDPDRRLQLRLEAGLDAAQAGQASMAQQILNSIQPSSLDNRDRARYELARTEVRIAGMAPDQALGELPPPRSGTDPEIAQRVWQKRADLQFAQNELIAGMRALVQRGVWLVDEQQLNYNDNAIYDKALDAIAYGQGPESRAARNADGTTRGWLALAAIGQQRFADRAARDQALASWENQYPGHPASRNVLAQRFNYDSDMTVAQPREPGDLGAAPEPTSDVVALALPLTGDFSSAAEAIRDGFLFAYEHDNSTPSRPRIYDTNTMSADMIMRQARQDNVGILVGPLNKTKVTDMSRLAGQMPIVALNYTDQPVRQPGFYQFALAPEDEARTVARHASDEGYARAIALVPQGDWGSRVFDAFRESFQSRGGQVVNYATYNADEHDHRGPIQSVLQSYRDGQVDFIFVAAAQPVQARLIRSQLRFYHATRLPMLSTSHIYSGTPDRSEDIDLNGVGFADLPWVIGNGDFLERRRGQAAQQYGDVAKRYSRLFAMGMDAWRLADEIGSGGLETGDTFEGMTGVLAVQADGRVKRFLAWAVFRNGTPQLADMPSPADAESDTTPAAPWARP